VIALRAVTETHVWARAKWRTLLTSNTDKVSYG
jgi:hypothetical protein